MILSDEYTKKYLILAVEYGIIQEKDLSDAWEELNPRKAIDVQKYYQYFIKSAF